MKAGSPSSVPATGPVPAGWYPDPWWAGSERWWDGTRWSHHARWSAVPPPPPAPPPLRTLDGRAFWVGLVAAAVIVVGARVLQELLVSQVRTLRGFQFLQWGFYLVVYGGMGASVILVARRFGSGAPRQDLGWSFRWSDLGWGPVLFVVTRILQAAVTAPLLALPVLRHSTQEYSDTMSRQPTELLITLVVVGVVVAPVVEELLFRGVLLRGLLARHPVAVAAIVQGVIFGCYHYAPELGWYNVVLLTANSVFGVVFGFVAVRRRSLGTGVVAHSVTNASAFLVIVLIG